LLCCGVCTRDAADGLTPLGGVWRAHARTRTPRTHAHARTRTPHTHTTLPLLPCTATCRRTPPPAFTLPALPFATPCTTLRFGHHLCLLPTAYHHTATRAPLRISPHVYDFQPPCDRWCAFCTPPTPTIYLMPFRGYLPCLLLPYHTVDVWVGRLTPRTLVW